MRKTKIICTMGPATMDQEVLKKLCLGGMNVARMNFSHGDHDSHLAQLNLLQEIREELGLPIGTMCDTKGPEIRTGCFQGGAAQLEAGQTFTLYGQKCIGDQNGCCTTYQNLAGVVEPGVRICIDDGLIELIVKEISGQDVVCTVANGGEVRDKKGINLPGTPVDLPFLSPKDRSDILFAVENGFDFIAASFTRSAQDIMDIRSLLDRVGAGSMEIIAKIENQQGIDNIDEIIAAADGIMVARGDLGVEVPSYQVPMLQKEIIERCRKAGKNVIVATQMLDSMIRNPRPTRAEVADVANAIYDGTDAIMLSGETAAGKYPIEAVTMMGEIAEQTERYLKFEDYRDGKALEGKLNVSAAVGSAAVSMVEHIKAACIVTPTMSGQTARLISNLRPSVPIYGVTPYEWARRKMQLYWGVRPVTGYEEDSTENIISHAMYMVRREELVERGDMVIFTAGDPATNEVTGEGYMTNMLHIIQAK